MKTHNTRTEVTRAFVVSQRNKYRELSKATGLDYSWLSKFACEVIADPASSKVDKLLHYMEANGHKLENFSTG